MNASPFLNSEEGKSTTWLHPVSGEAVITGHRKTPGEVSVTERLSSFSVVFHGSRVRRHVLLVTHTPKPILPTVCGERGCDIHAVFLNAWVGFWRSCCEKWALSCPPLPGSWASTSCWSVSWSGRRLTTVTDHRDDVLVNAFSVTLDKLAARVDRAPGHVRARDVRVRVSRSSRTAALPSWQVDTATAAVDWGQLYICNIRFL